MSVVKKILNNIKWLLFANIYSALSKFIIIIALAQVTSPKEVGIYSLGLAVTAPITLLFNMKMKSVIITEENLNIILFSRIRLVANISAFISIIFIVVFLYESYLFIFIMIGIMKILDLNSEFYQSLHNRNKNFYVTSKLIISKYSFVTLSFIIVIYLTGSLEKALTFYIVVQILHLIIERYYFNKYEKVHYNFHDTSYKVLLIFMIPLGISQMLYSFGASIPKYFLEYFGNIEQVGIFSALLYFITIINLFMNSVLQSLLPYIRDIYNKDYNKFNKFLYIYSPIFSTLIGVILIIPVGLIGEETLYYIYGQDYAENYKLLYLFIIAIVFSIIGWVYDTALLISKKTKQQPLLTFINISLTIVISIIAFNINVLIGASFSLIVYQFFNSTLKLAYYRGLIFGRRG